MRTLHVLLAALVLLSAHAEPRIPRPDDAPDVEFLPRLTPLEGTRPAQWRIVWTSAPATEATVSWTTAEAGTEHRVLYGPAGAQEEGAPYPHAQTTHRDGPYTLDGGDGSTPGHYHHARLRDLEPSTTYRFVLESDGVRSRELRFTTAPTDARPFSILAGGDSRSGWRERCFLNLAIAGLARDESVLAFSHGGDYVLDGERWDHWSRWLSHHELATTAEGRVLPLVPTRGNHDRGPLFGEIFDDPGGPRENGGVWFRTRLSPEVSLVTLDTNVPVAGDQLEWLEGELAAAAAETRWLLASYHRALYPAVKSPGEARAFWPPAFERHGVDLVLESDGHCIKRTLPIRGDEPHPAGVVYVGEGGLGVPQRDPRTDPWYLQPPGLVAKGHHVLRLEFTPEALHGLFLGPEEIPGRHAAEDFRAVVPANERWAYLAADDAPDGWTRPGFDDSAWPVGRAGFGYGDDDDATVLADMRGAHERLHLRRVVDGDVLTACEDLTLMVRYDDGFVAWLNGVEVARAGVEPPDQPGEDPRVRAHEALATEAFPLAGWREHVRAGDNVLALVGHNRMKSDRDFTLDPWLAGERLADPTRSPLELRVLDVFTLAPRER